ncbi:p-glycoprotein [Ilyonectria robusta]
MYHASCRFRALYTVGQDWGAARLSGVGRRRQSGDVIPLDESIDVDVSEPIVDENWVRINLLKSRFGEENPPGPPIISQPLWGFALHTRCWRLLCAISDINFRGRSSVQVLFDICRSQPIQFGLLHWGHDYSGLVCCWGSMENSCPGEEVKLLCSQPTDGSYRHDPMDTPHLTMYIPSDTESTGSDSGSTRSQKTRQQLKPVLPSSNDPFRLLPPELLVDILVQTKSSDAASLRLASKTMANIGLPEKFWRSRFWPGHEFEHVFEVARWPTPEGGWSAWHHKFWLQRTDPCLKNRQRVWPLACRLRDLFALGLESPVRHRSPCKSLFDLDAKNSDLVWHTAHSKIFPATSTFSEGPRSLHDAKVTITGPTDTV